MEYALACIGPLVPPCVWAATLKAMMDGWRTGEASRTSIGCLFGCQHGQDGITHYAYCPSVQQMSTTRLCLKPVPVDRRLDNFLLLDT